MAYNRGHEAKGQTGIHPRQFTITLAMPASSITRVTVNRAPVLTLWAAVVAERLGFDWNESLTLGRAVAGLNAYSKGKALGIFHPKPKDLAEQRKKLKQGEL